MCSGSKKMYVKRDFRGAVTQRAAGRRGGASCPPCDATAATRSTGSRWEAGGVWHRGLTLLSTIVHIFLAYDTAGVNVPFTGTAIPLPLQWHCVASTDEATKSLDSYGTTSRQSQLCSGFPVEACHGKPWLQYRASLLCVSAFFLYCE